MERRKIWAIIETYSLGLNNFKNAVTSKKLNTRIAKIVIVAKKKRHQPCQQLTDRYQHHRIKNLNLKNMIQRGLKGHAKSIHDASMGDFI